MPAEERALTILHTGDLHGQLDAMPYLATVIRKSREAHPGSLLLDAGGWACGGKDDAVSRAFQGKPMIEIMNEMAWNAAGIGEGDLTWGVPILRERAAESRFPLLAANLRDGSRQPIPHVQPHVLIEHGGFRVGLIGVCCRQCERPGATLVLDPTETVRASIQRMQGEGAEVLIVLSHLGMDLDRNLAAALPALHCIIGGHSLAEPAEPIRVGDTVIAHAGHSAQHLGVLTIHLQSTVQSQ